MVRVASPNNAADTMFEHMTSSADQDSTATELDRSVYLRFADGGDTLMVSVASLDSDWVLL